MTESNIKENIINIMSKGSRHRVVRFLHAVASSNNITYTGELRHLDTKIGLVTRYRERFLIKLKDDMESLKSLRMKLADVERRLRSPNLNDEQKDLLANEMEVNQKKLMLLEDEINKIRKMHDVLDDVSIENKEKLFDVKRKIERSMMKIDELKG
ncbi:MAG: hypothetical protein ABIG89_01705 [Candidatus Woesearchaeota archaeon]